jgi:hypothetical protein
MGGALKTGVTAAALGSAFTFGGVEMIIDYLARRIASPR